MGRAGGVAWVRGVLSLDVVVHQEVEHKGADELQGEAVALGGSWVGCGSVGVVCGRGVTVRG